MTVPASPGDSGISPRLDYAPGEAVRRRRRNRRIVYVLLALALVAAGVALGPSLYRRSVRAYWAQRVRTYAAPVDRVVYEEDPGRWPALLGGSGYRSMKASSPGWNSFVAYLADPVSRLASAAKLRMGATAIFAHARRTPSGGERVVVVWLAYNGVRCNAQGASPDNQVRIDVHASVWDGRTLKERYLAPWIAPQEVARDRDTPLYLRMYAGQPDPNDPSRFTIPFEIGDHKDVLDGRLRDDGTVVLRPRNHEHMLNPK